jgi:hypothetical protein
MFIDTGVSIPIGTIIKSGTANILFRNIPPSTPDPYVDFFLSAANTATVTIPEPATLGLIAVAVLGF